MTKEKERLRADLTIIPDNPIAHKKMGDVYFLERNYPAALQEYAHLIAHNSRHLLNEVMLAFQHAILRSPEDTGLRLCLVDLYRSLDRYEDAVDELEDILELEPANVSALNTLLAISVRSASKTKVIAMLEQAVDHSLVDPTLLNVLTSYYVENADFPKALLVYERILQQQPHNTEMISTAAELHIRMKQYAHAAGFFELLIRENTSFAQKTVVRLEEMLLDARDEEKKTLYFVLAKALLKDLKPERAVACYEKVLELCPEDALILEQALKDLLGTFPEFPAAQLMLAKLYLRRKNYSESVTIYNHLVHSNPHAFSAAAIDGYKSVLAECPEQALALQSLGELYMAKHDHAAACEQFTTLLSLSEETGDYVIEKCKKILRVQNSITVRHLLGKAYLIKQQFTKALEEGTALMKQAPEASLGYALSGEAYCKMRQPQKAIELLKRALRASPYDRTVQTALGTASRSRLLLQVKHLEEQASRSKDAFSLHAMLGKKLFLLRELDKAVPELQQALKDKPHRKEAHTLLGMVFKEKGRYDLAAIQFRQVIEEEGERLSADERLKYMLYIAMADEAFGRSDTARELYEQVLLMNSSFMNVGMRSEVMKRTPDIETRGKILLALIPFEGADTCVLCQVHNQESDTFKERQFSPISFSVEHNGHGVNNALKKRIGDAIKDLKVAISLDRSLTAAHNNLGVLALQEKDWDLATEHFQHAIYCNQQIGVVFANIGCLHHLQKHYEKAEKYYYDALAADPSLHAVQIGLGDLLYQKGQIEDALILWRRARELCPVPEFAERRLMWRTTSA